MSYWLGSVVDMITFNKGLFLSHCFTVVSRMVGSKSFIKTIDHCRVMR